MNTPNLEKNGQVIIPLHLLNLVGKNNLVNFVQELLSVSGNSKDFLKILQKQYESTEPSDVRRLVDKEKILSNNQFEISLESTLRELVANAVDAINTGSPIGQFGKGGTMGILAFSKSVEAINRVEGIEQKILITPQGKTYKVIIPKPIEYSTDGQTTVKICPRDKFMADYNKIWKLGLISRDPEMLKVLKEFKFIEGATIQADFYNADNQIQNSTVINPNTAISKSNNLTLPTVFVKFYEDHFEVINPSSAAVHPATFYTNSQSEKLQNKPVKPKLEIWPENKPAIYILGPSGVVAQKIDIYAQQSGFQLIPDSLVSSKITLPLSLNATRSSADFQQKGLEKNWAKILQELDENTKDKVQLLKFCNTLVIYIKSLQTNVDANSVLQYGCLNKVISLAKKTIEQIKTENPKAIVLPNLKSFSRVRLSQNENESKPVFVDSSFLETKDLQNVPGSVHPDSGIFINSQNTVLGVDLEYDNRLDWDKFVEISKRIQKSPLTAFNDLNLPILALPDDNNPREFKQIWLPKELINQLNDKYKHLQSLYEYGKLLELHNQGQLPSFQQDQNKMEDLSRLQELEFEYDQFIALLQIVCSPKTSYESNFHPKVDFKTSSQIQLEISNKLENSLTKQTASLQSNLPEVNTKHQTDKQLTFEKLRDELGLNQEMQTVLNQILDITFAESYVGLGELEFINDMDRDDNILYMHFTAGGTGVRYYIDSYDNNNIEITAECRVQSNFFELNFPSLGINSDIIDKDSILLMYCSGFNTNVNQVLNDIGILVIEPFFNKHLNLAKIFEGNWEEDPHRLDIEGLLKENSEIHLLGLYNHLIGELRSEVIKFTHLLESVKTLQKPNLKKLLKGQVASPEDYTPEYVGVIMENGESVKVWVVRINNKQSYLLFQGNNNTRIQSFDFEIYEGNNVKISDNCVSIEDAGIESALVKRQGFQRISGMLVLNKTIKPRMYAQIDGHMLRDESYYDSEIFEVSLDGKIIIIKDFRIGKHDVLFATKNGYYVYPGNQTSENVSIVFLPLQQLIEYPEGSGIVIEPLRIFSINKDKVVSPPHFGDNPHFVLKDEAGSVTILEVKQLIEDFDKKYTESRESQELVNYREEYVDNILKPNLELFVEFWNQLELPDSDKELFMKFLMNGITGNILTINKFEIDKLEVREYLDLINDLMPEIITSIHKASKSEYYQDNPEYLNIDFLESLFFRNDKIPNAKLILETYKHLNSDEELLDLVNGDRTQLFYWLYKTFFVFDEGSIYNYSKLSKDRFEIENLKKFMYLVILSFNTLYYGDLTIARINTYPLKDLLYLQILSKAYGIIKDLRTKGVLKPEDFANIVDVSSQWQAISYGNQGSPEGLNPVAQSYYNYFALPEDTFLRNVIENVDLAHFQTNQTLEQYLVEKLKVTNKTLDSDKADQYLYKKAQSMISGSLEAVQLQSKDSVRVILQELLQNAVDTTKKKQTLNLENNYQSTINISRSQVTGSGQFLEPDKQYFEFSVEDNGQGVEFVKLFQAFGGSKQKDSGQQGFFGIGANTMFGIEDGVQRLESCYSNPDGNFTHYVIWLKSEVEPTTKKRSITLLGSQERQVMDPSTATFTKVSVYKPVDATSSILDILNFDKDVISNTQLIGTVAATSAAPLYFKPKITFNETDLKVASIAPTDSATIQYKNYSVNINSFMNSSQLDNTLYINNRPMMRIESFLANNGINNNHWLFKLACTSSISFSFDYINDKVVKENPLDIARTNFADKEFGKQVFEVFIAQALSYQSSQLVMGGNAKLLADDVLQFGIRGDSFNRNKTSQTTRDVADIVNQVLFGHNQESSQGKDLIKTISEAADIKETEVLQLIKFKLPEEPTLEPMTFLEISKEYRRVLYLNSRNQSEQAFLDWIIGTPLGQGSRLTIDNDRAINYMKLQSSREYEVIEPSAEEVLKLQKFEIAADNILSSLNKYLGTNFVQEYFYSQSEQGAAANWKVTGDRIQWFWDKDNLLDKLDSKGLKEVVDLYVHELTHVIEGKLDQVLVGSEDGNITTHGLEFLRHVSVGALLTLISWNLKLTES